MHELEIGAIDAAFSDLGYPSALMADYDQLECLACRRGRETFLMRRKADGALAVAKCYDRRVFPGISGDRDVTDDLDCPGLPRFLGRWTNERYVCVLREYVPGQSLAEHVRDQELTQERIVEICVRLCDILEYLHSRPVPVIHRDVKPENIILGEDGGVYLIDFDIARAFKPEAESDTLFFGTRGYAAPEQYGFAQSDARTDIYSMGVLLRFLLTGSVRKNSHIRLYRPLERIIERCTAFAPDKRYPDIRSLRQALRSSDPRTQLLRRAGLVLGVLVLCAGLAFGGVKLYRWITYTPFTADAIPAYLPDEERVADALRYIHDTYGAELFDRSDDFATAGDLRRALMTLYGLDRDYVYGECPGVPQESEDCFMPWGFDDVQHLSRDIAVYAAVKVHDPAIVADWSSLKDDNGWYPGVRVAVSFAEKTGILSGVNHPQDITLGELALLFANADRVFAAAEQGQ